MIEIVKGGQMRWFDVAWMGGGRRLVAPAAADNSQLAPIKTQKKIDPSRWRA